MFGDLFSGWHLLIVVAVVVLLFGATRLPALAKGVGQSIKIFKGEIRSINEDDAKASGVESATSAAAPAEPLTKL
jgi:sec-independent protein translocase protein TatA